ncbi:MAG: hypothetical protein H6739_17605 [Alphaproteobacteria bacterium]|nr:hypothetical protein [Alphaproteobacteria bacterium]
MTAPGAPVTFGLAQPAEEPQLRRVLRDNPMAGAVSVAFQREPDFFAAATIEGPVHQCVVARTEAGEVVGLCSRSVRPVWLNGEIQEVGYLSMLRLDAAWRGRPRMLKGGFEAVHRLHEADKRTAFAFTTIIEDNHTARRILERGLPGFPTYHPREVMVTLAMPTWRRRRAPRVPGVDLRQATAAELPDLADCLGRNLRRTNLAPAWTAEDLADPALCRGLAPGDFTVALRGGRVVGCVALWDQQGFKQSVVAGYEGGLGRFRGVVNAAAPWVGVPRLPAPGEPLRHAFLSHLAADEDALLPALLVAAYNRSLSGGYAYLTTMLAERHPMTAPLKRRFGAIEYRSVLYLVCWPDGADAVAAVDDRLPQPEVAVL